MPKNAPGRPSPENEFLAAAFRNANAYRVPAAGRAAYLAGPRAAAESAAARARIIAILDSALKKADS